MTFFTSHYYFINMNDYYVYILTNKTNDVKSAIQREKNIKKWNRDWKLELIKKTNPNFNDLSLEWV